MRNKILINWYFSILLFYKKTTVHVNIIKKRVLVFKSIQYMLQINGSVTRSEIRDCCQDLSSGVDVYGNSLNQNFHVGIHEVESMVNVIP